MYGEIIVDTFLTIGTMIVLLGIFELIRVRWMYVKMEEN